MKKGNILIASLFLMVTFFSCSKEKSFEGPEKGGSYLPQDTLHYEDTTLHSGFRLISTDSVKVMDSITFHAYQNIPDDHPQDTTYTFLGDSSGSYYVKSFLAELGDKKLLVLKQDAEVGDSWVNTVTVNGTSLHLTFRVKEKGISYMVNNHTFQPVTHLKILAEQLVNEPGGGGGSMSFPVGDVYFAPDVGIIQLDIRNPLDESSSVHLLLTNIE